MRISSFQLCQFESFSSSTSCARASRENNAIMYYQYVETRRGIARRSNTNRTSVGIV
jgi:hypothetical protein